MSFTTSRMFFIQELVFLALPTLFLHAMFSVFSGFPPIGSLFSLFNAASYYLGYVGDFAQKNPGEQQYMLSFFWRFELPLMIASVTWLIALWKFGQAAIAFLSNGRDGAHAIGPQVRSGFLWSIPFILFVLTLGYPFMQLLVATEYQFSANKYVAIVAMSILPAMALSGLGVFIPAFHLWLESRTSKRLLAAGTEQPAALASDG